MDAAYKAATGKDPTTATKNSCCYEIQALSNFVDPDSSKQAANAQKYTDEGLPVTTSESVKYMCDKNVN